MIFRHKDKEAQVSLFVIIIIVLIAVIGLFFSLKIMPNLGKNSNSAVRSLETYLEGCFENSVEDSLVLVGIQGGYTILPARYLAINESKIAYWYYLGQDTKPSMKEIENQMDRFIKTSLESCDLNKFKDYEVKKGEIKLTIKADLDKVDFSLNWPITMTKGDATYRLAKTYKRTINVRLGRIYNVSAEIVKKEIANGDNFDIGYLLSSEMDSEILPQDNNTVITYVIKDVKSKVNSEGYIFMFSNRFKE